MGPNDLPRVVDLLTFHVCPVHTHTRLTALCSGLPGCAGTRKVKPIWILLKQETVSGSGISWAICKCAPDKYHSSTPPLSFFTGRMPFLPPNQQCQSTEGILMSRTVSIIMYLAIQTIRMLRNISVASVLYYVPPTAWGH